MRDHITLNKQHPTQNFHKNLKKNSKTPKVLEKTQNLGLIREMHEKRGILDTYQRRNADLGWNASG